MTALVRASALVGVRLMTGSDYLESVAEAYRRHAGPAAEPQTGQTFTEHLYHCLRSLMSDKTRHPSLLLDHLYQLRSEGDRLGTKNAEVRTILASLLCTTNFLRHLSGDVAIVDSKRGTDMLDTLLAYREQTRQLFPPPMPRKKVSKGKGRANDVEEVHLHQAAQVSQIHELFPDLPSGYILRLLDNFSNDVEQVTAALLEPSSLPPSLQDPLPPPDLAPRTTPPPIPHRKNVFDNDDFDRLRISSKNIHKGRREINIDESGSAEERNRSKAATLAALARFDSDDDERDDTYDAVDVGGSLDQSVDTDTRPRGERAQEQNPHEEILYRAWKDSATLFARDSQTRISKVRQDLKRQTGMSDEQLEGWAIMLSRDSALQRKLQKRYEAVGSFQGNQRVLEQTRWQANTSGENSMDEGEAQSSDTGNERPRGGGLDSHRGRGRGGPTFVTPSGAAPGGRGRGRGRGGGRANHGRREGRARKMGRGMAGAPGVS
jgi:activating signal cointegrator complex subunit 2